MRFALVIMLFACSDPYAAEDRATLRRKDTDFGQQLEALHPSELATRSPTCKAYLDAIAADRKARLACDKPNMLEAFGAQQITLKRVREFAAIQDPAQIAAACESAQHDLERETHCMDR